MDEMHKKCCIESKLVAYDMQGKLVAYSTYG